MAMALLENKLTDAVLARIRVHNDGDKEGHDAARRATGRVCVREAILADFDPVYALTCRLGQGRDSVENWNRLWRDNPALQDRADTTIGWVLVAGSEIVGFLGSIPLTYQYQGQDIKVATTCRFAVDPVYRAYSNLLITSFMRQKGVDLILNTTATIAAGKIMSVLKADCLSLEEYGTVLFWVLDARAFAQSIARKMRMRSLWSGITATFLCFGFQVNSLWKRRPSSTQYCTLKVEFMPIENLGEDFDAFCARIFRNSSRLMGRRTSEVLRWHFIPPSSDRLVHVLICSSANGMRGYMVLRHEKDAKTGLKRTIMADLLTEEDPAVLEELFNAAYKQAKAEGSAVLEVLGFPKNVRNVLRKSKPYVRKFPATPFFYKAKDRTLQDKLRNSEAWYACPFDGDATLWP